MSILVVGSGTKTNESRLSRKEDDLDERKTGTVLGCTAFACATEKSCLIDRIHLCCAEIGSFLSGASSLKGAHEIDRVHAEEGAPLNTGDISLSRKYVLSRQSSRLCTYCASSRW